MELEKDLTQDRFDFIIEKLYEIYNEDAVNYLNIYNKLSSGEEREEGKRFLRECLIEDTKLGLEYIKSLAKANQVTHSKAVRVIRGLDNTIAEIERQIQ